jgi:hypothetical protein
LQLTFLKTKRSLLNSRYLLFLLIVLGVAACSSNSQRLGNDYYPPKRQLLYFSHQSGFENDTQQLFPKVEKANAPAGLVIHTSLSLRLSDELTSGYELASLTSLFEEYPNTIPVFLFSIDRTQLVPLCEGEYEDRLQRLAAYFESLQRPIYLTVGWEVNNPLYKISPEPYVAAYRCFVDRLTALGVDNVSYIWYINGMSPTYENRDIADWYPGDAYVNWIGTSLYKWKAEHYTEKAVFNAPNYERLFEFATSKKLPVVILESSATAIKKNFLATDNSIADSISTTPNRTLWELYYAPFFQFIDSHPSIRAFTHVYNEWNDPVLTQQWMTALEQRTMIFSNDQLYQQIGYSAK